MPRVPIDEAMEVAFQHHQAGRAAEAEGILRQILIDQPTHEGAWHHLGKLFMDTGQTDEAVAALGEAVRLNPHFIEAHYDLGIALMNLQRPEEAIGAWQRVTQLQPDHAEAYGQMARALRVVGRVDEAIEAIAACTRAIESQSIRARGYRARSFTSTGSVCTTSPSAEGLISKIRENSADRSANASEFFGGSI